MRAKLKDVIDVKVNHFDWLAYYVIDSVEENRIKITFYTVENVKNIGELLEAVKEIERATKRKVIWICTMDSSKYIILQRRLKKCLKALKYKLLQIICSSCGIGRSR